MKRCLIGKTVLDEAVKMYRERYTVTSIVRFLGIDKFMHYRTAYDIIRSDRQKLYHITRPDWLVDDPIVQEAPDGWQLDGGLRQGKWVYLDGGN